MAQTAHHHAKLWFAGQAQNWELAAYELDELEEGLESAAHYHPTHKHISQALTDLIADSMTQPLTKMKQVIENKDRSAFRGRYAEITEACNACHLNSGFGFNVVIQPTSNPFSNQSFQIAN